MRLAPLVLLLLGCASPTAYACAGAIPVDLRFLAQTESLDPAEQSKLEAAVQKARAGATFGLRVAFAVYSQHREAASQRELERLTERRVDALRNSMLALGFASAAITAVRGEPASPSASGEMGGSAEVEIAFACQGS